ncbi:branched-chain amino acid transport system II carrier protein [Streptococcus dentapri]|uniref:Branched-chain amino acid transport system carrier protein n=1 Tax=Streptococcus dentapri TaxID=573564 RepID=A0ABV8CZC7_9STRE
MQQKSVYWIIGFMLFALFFGAGNLIFPAYLGIYSGANLWLAILGFCLTGVTLPLLGVVAVAYSGKTNVESIAQPASKAYALFFAISLYLSIGPFFAIPRTGAVSYEIGIQPFFGDKVAVQIIYGIIFFGLSYLIAVKPSKIADRIGKYLTPALLIFLGILIFASFIAPAGELGQAHNASPAVNDSFRDLPFVAGLIQGYSTMDALASLAFAILIIDAAKGHGAKTPRAIAQLTLKSGIIAALILAAIYILVGRLGATSQSLFNFSNGQFTLNSEPISDGGPVLIQSASHYMDSIGQVVLAMAIFLACLTTATGLITACAEYFHKIIPKLSHTAWATIFTLIATTLYFGGLADIIKWSIPVLYLLYPLTIVTIILIFLKSVIGDNPIIYRTTLSFTAIAGLFDASNTLAKQTQLFLMPEGIVKFFTKIIPLGSYNMGWICFAGLGLVIGLILTGFKPNKNS